MALGPRPSVLGLLVAGTLLACRERAPERQPAPQPAPAQTAAPETGTGPGVPRREWWVRLRAPAGVEGWRVIDKYDRSSVVADVERGERCS